MSEENVELVRSAIDAFNRQDVETFVACFHPETEYLLLRNLLEGGSYRGQNGVRQALADALETWESVHIEIEEVRPFDGGCAVFSRAVNVGKDAAPTVEYQAFQVGRVRDGKIIDWWPYLSREEALEAAGVAR